jgi:hypothetical protein
MFQIAFISNAAILITQQILVKSVTKTLFLFRILIPKNYLMCKTCCAQKNNSINAKDAQSVTNNQNLINSDSEIFLINEKLREPLLHIANKLLGRQNLNFDQLTPPEQKL